MISIKHSQVYCKDDISLIENYDKAINSKENWDCHHRLEIELNVSRQYLIDNDLYYNRPASELIFLTHSEHKTLHNKGERNPMYDKKGEKHPMYGKHHTKESRNKMSENRKGLCTGESNCNFGKNLSGENNGMYGKHHTKESRNKMSEHHYNCKGINNPMYGKPSANRGKHRVYREDGSYYMSF